MAESVFSRAGNTSPLGKLTAEVKFRLDESTFDGLEAEARKAGLTVSEFLRDLVMVRVHGASFVRSIYEARLQLVVGKSPE